MIHSNLLYHQWCAFVCLFQVITRNANIRLNSWNTYTIANLAAGFDSMVVTENGTRPLQLLGESFQSFDFASYNDDLFIGGHPQLSTVQVCVHQRVVCACVSMYICVASCLPYCYLPGELVTTMPIMATMTILYYNAFDSYDIDHYSFMLCSHFGIVVCDWHRMISTAHFHTHPGI